MKLPLPVTTIINEAPKKRGDLWFTGSEFIFKSWLGTHIRSIDQLSGITAYQITTMGLEEVSSIDLLFDKGRGFFSTALILKLDGSIPEHTIFTDHLLSCLKLPRADWDLVYSSRGGYSIYKRG